MVIGVADALEKKRRSLVGPKGDINFGHFQVQQVPLERNPSALSNNTCVSGNDSRYKRGAMSQFKVKTTPGGNKLYTNIGETASQMVMLIAHQNEE